MPRFAPFGLMKRDAKHEPQKQMLFSSARQLPVRSALRTLVQRPCFYSSSPDKRCRRSQTFLLYMKSQKLSSRQNHNHFKSKKNFIVYFGSFIIRIKSKKLPNLSKIFLFSLAPSIFVCYNIYITYCGRNHGLLKPVFCFFLFCALHGLADRSAHDQAAERCSVAFFACLLRMGRSHASPTALRHDVGLLSRCTSHRRFARSLSPLDGAACNGGHLLDPAWIF